MRVSWASALAALPLCVNLLGPVVASPVVKPALPVTVSDEAWAPLYQAVDERLQRQLERALTRRPDWSRLIADKKMAVGVVDLSQPARPRFARVNGSKMMYAASLPKIAILLAAYARMDEGRMALTPEIEQDLAAMIRVSSNGAATRMIDRLGGLAKVNAVLADPRYRLYDTRRNGGLWVGKAFDKGGVRMPDPVNGISHGATITQVSRFYYQLATGRLISRDASVEMLRMLADPAIDHKFVKALRARAPEAHLSRKSGTWHQYHADSALVWGPDWRRYILVGIVESEHGERILRDLVGTVETVLRPAAVATVGHDY